MAIDRTGISSLQSGAGEITYSGNEGPKSPDQQLMAQADPMLVEMYQQYVFEMEEQGRQPMSFREFMQQALSGMAQGGRAGFQRGGGADWINTHDPGPMGNPPVMEKIEDMREFRIANPDIEDVADYKGYYERLKELQRLMDRGELQRLMGRGMAYGGSANPTYTQKRKQSLAYGGIAGVDGRKRYGIGSWFQDVKDKFVDDIIPNEIKENPILSSVAAGALLNQFGIPFTGQFTKSGDPFGENWLGNLINKDLVIGPGGEQPKVLSQLVNKNLPNTALTKATNVLTGGGINPIDPTGMIPQLDKQGPEDPWYQKALQTILPGGKTGYFDLYGPTQMQTKQGMVDVNWKGPLMGGLGIGALASRMPKDTLTPDTSGIDIANIRSRALTGSDPGLHFLPQASATTAYAKGGRTGYYAGERVEQDMITAFSNYKNQGGIKDFSEWYSDTYLPEMASMRPDEVDPWAEGAPYGFAPARDILKPEAITIGKALPRGRIGYDNGGDVMMASAPDPMDERNSMMENLAIEYFGKPLKFLNEREIIEIEEMMDNMDPYGSKPMAPQGIQMAAQGGRIGYATGRNEYLKRLEHLMFLGYDYDSAKEIAQDDDKYQIESTRGLGNAQGGRIGAQEGGLMDLGGMEKDYREEGGFVPIGGQERADDVPARLSKNEFVFTADAVRSAGGGDIDKGAEVMENVMEHLEQGGQISEDSQGLEGARNMFATAQRLEGVM